MVPENSNSLTHFTRNDGEYILTTVQGMKLLNLTKTPNIKLKLFLYFFSQTERLIYCSWGTNAS